ncbi:GIY-YIG nuclease family protein [Streptomyces californicus]|uniref:GIY-YIG nuclease family protein n=1 Tax=Streptomyces californicus TaxID=67351 RepID=UPI00367E0206
MDQQNLRTPSRQVIAPPRPAHATDRYDGPTFLYRLYDDADRLLYIGVTCNPTSRWGGHRKDKDWWGQVARKDLTTYPNRSAALTAEQETIAAEKPLHNVQHNPLSNLRHVHLVVSGDRARKLEALARSMHVSLTGAVLHLIDEAHDPRLAATDSDPDMDEALRRARTSRTAVTA